MEGNKMIMIYYVQYSVVIAREPGIEFAYTTGVSRCIEEIVVGDV